MRSFVSPPSLPSGAEGRSPSRRWPYSECEPYIISPISNPRARRQASMVCPSADWGRSVKSTDRTPSPHTLLLVSGRERDRAQRLPLAVLIRAVLPFGPAHADRHLLDTAVD